MKDTLINKKWTKYRDTFFLFGMCCSLFIVFTAFKLSIPIQSKENPKLTIDKPLDTNQTPITYHRKVRKLPPQKTIEKVKIDIPPKIVTETIDYIESDPLDNYEEEEDFTGESFVEESKTEGKIEIEKKEEEDPIVIFASRMPVFGDCREIEDKKVREKCSEKALLEYMYDNISYPEIAKKNNIQGTVYAELVIDKEGKVSNIKIVRHPGGGLDKVVMKMLEEMPSWEAGKNNFRPVKVKFTVPVTFKLN